MFVVEVSLSSGIHMSVIKCLRNFKYLILLLVLTFIYSKMIHCTISSKQIFPEMKLRGLVPYSYIHVSVTDFYHRYMNAGIRNKAAQFHFWKHINRIFFAVYEYIRQRTYTFLHEV
jgi:hypothetical protein